MTNFWRSFYTHVLPVGTLLVLGLLLLAVTEGTAKHSAEYWTWLIFGTLVFLAAVGLLGALCSRKMKGPHPDA